MIFLELDKHPHFTLTVDCLNPHLIVKAQVSLLLEL